MNHVRIQGDPFGDDTDAGRLRSFLRLAEGNGMRCSLSLSAVAPRPPADGATVIPLTDGVRDLSVATRLPPAEVEHLLRAAGADASATAPVVVFAAAAALDDAARLAACEWPEAAAVVAARPDTTAAELLARVRAELRWAGAEQPEDALRENELRPWLSLPAASPGGPIVHVGSGFADGTDLVVDVWCRHFAAGRALRLVMPAADGRAVAAVRERAGDFGAALEVRQHDFEPADVADAAVIALPWRRVAAPAVLVRALASGLCPSAVASWPSTTSTGHTSRPILPRSPTRWSARWTQRRPPRSSTAPAVTSPAA
jgi:hypothetical protein